MAQSCLRGNWRFVTSGYKAGNLTICDGKTGGVGMAFTIEGAERAGRWLVTCDHATNRVPVEVNGGSLGIAPEDMARHIA